ncbi:MAG: hypothetical protein KJ804_18770 [Proteobacteria bacterium]|nr:hypothetical protein [Pseudomonadota bacterium]
MFSKKRNQARRLYLAFWEKQESEEIAAFYAKKNLSSILGGEGFKDWLRENFQEFRFIQDDPKSKELALSGHVIRKLVGKEFKIENDALMLFKTWNRESCPGFGHFSAEKVLRSNPC